MHPVGVIHGRFQILHNDHMRYLLAGKSRCRHLVIGITNPDPRLSKEDPANPERSDDSANPLTYFERYTLITAAMREAGVPDQDFSVVPFPINFPELYRYYVPLDAVFFLTIYDKWGERKFDLLSSRQLQVEVLWRRSPEEKGLSGTEVRDRIRDGGSWEELAPRSSIPFLLKWKIAQRLARLRTGSAVLVEGS